MLNKTIIFTNRSQIKITGSKNTIIECKQNVGLAFKYMSNIEILSIAFYDCGMVFNSTSQHPNSTDATLISKAALLFQYCTNLTLQSIVIKNSDGVGVQMYNTIGKVFISHSTFSNNKINETFLISGGGGLSIEFSLCEPGTSGEKCNLTNSGFTINATYKIIFSNFINNSATVTDPKEMPFFQPNYFTHYAVGRGGGLSVHINGNASYNDFIIENCIFENNTALYGGGMFIEVQDKGYNNTFIIQNSNFFSNRVITTELDYLGTSGGGIMLRYIIISQFSQQEGINVATFINTTFSANAAYNGGGFSFHCSKVDTSDVMKSFTVLRFIGCHWCSNIARLGAAIDLGIQNPFENRQLVQPQFINCTFASNVVTGFTVGDRNAAYSIIDPNSTITVGSYWPGAGAVYLDTLTISFVGYITFTNNTGGAIVAINTRINIHANASVKFSNNLAVSGGALYLAGYSWISTSPNVRVSFINNSAHEYGGAIYFEKSSSGNSAFSVDKCFLQYSDDTRAPYDWNVTFIFFGNCASMNPAVGTEKNKGDAIYTTTVVDCTWNNSFSGANLKDTFLHWPNFKFQPGNCNCKNFLQTAARYFKYNGPSNASLVVAPGEIFAFPFIAINDFNEPITTTFMIHSSDQNVTINTPIVKTGGATSMRTIIKSNNSFYLQFETIDTRKHVGYIIVTMINCPMGFVLNNGVCECINSYDGLAYCNSSGELEIYILAGYWAGYVKPNKTFFSAYACPYLYCLQASNPVRLTNDSDVLCKNRTGRLCGDCKHGYGLSVGTLSCVNCTGSHVIAWIILIATTYIPITVVFILLLVLNMNLAVGPIHSFIFFCQTFPALSLCGDHWGDYSSTMTTINNIHRALTNIMSLKFDLYFRTNYCLMPNMNAMDYYLLQYASALYPLLIMTIILSIIRYCPGCIPARYLWYAIKPCVKAIRKRTSFQQTIIHGFITFMLLTYANFVNISFQILVFGYFEDKTGQHESVIIPAWQGTMNYFGEHHLPYACIAIFFLLIFGILPPLLLIFYPAILMIIAYFEWDNTNQVRTLRKWIPLYKLMPVFDSFWSEFKPNCQIFAGLYFLYRFLPFAFFAFLPTIFQVYFGVSILFIIVMFLHAYFQPYKKPSYNRIDFFIFAIISIINYFYAYSGFLRTQNATHSTIRFYWWIRTSLAWVPVAFILCYITFKIVKHCTRNT